MLSLLTYQHHNAVIAVVQMVTADARATMENSEQKDSSIDKSAASYFAADPAADMWALGLVAWELFTGQAFFGAAMADEQVVSILLGYELLPFETDPSMWCLFEDPQVRLCLRANNAICI